MKLYLDVDGVLNALGKSAWDDAVTTRADSGGGIFYPINASPSIGPALLATGADIHWLTTWEDMANKSISPLVNLPQDLPVAGKLDWSRPWKVDAIMKLHYGSSEPFVWVDDEAIPAEADLAFPSALLVRTNPATGLTQTQIDEIGRFISEQGK